LEDDAVQFALDVLSIPEAQMAADAGFLRRLYAETARLVQQQPAIHH
jgi:hypothetical protein